MTVLFGKLPVRYRRVVFHGLSPYEQRAWAKTISHGVPNMGRRFVEAIPTIAPSFIFGIGLYVWGEKEHRRSVRKDKKLYENDV